MRITNRMIATNMLSTVAKNRDMAAKLQLDIATTKRVRRPSDDPTGVIQIERFKWLISRNEQYVKNITLMNDFMSTSNTALESGIDLIEKAKDLAIRGSSDVLNDEARQSLAIEVDQLIDVMVDIGNTRYGGRYVFGGTLTTGTDPFTRVGDVITYNGNGKAINGKIGFEAEVTYNKTGVEVFNPAGGPDVFGALVSLKQGLEANDISAVQTALVDLTDSMDHLISVSSQVGILQERLSSTEIMVENENISFADQVSKIQDTDTVEALVNSKILENAINSGLQTMANVLQTSLMDFVS